MIRRALDSWFRPVDPIRLDLFRRCFAFSFLVYMAFRFYHGYEWLTDYGFHTTAQTKLAPYLDPLPTLPGWAVPVMALLVLASCLGMMTGRLPRLAAAFALGWSVTIQFVDISSAFTLNRLYVVIFALLAVAPPVREYRNEDGGSVSLQSAWPVRVVQAMIVIQYFTAGTCKICCGGSWLEHVDVLWSQSQGVFRTEIAAFMLRHVPKPIWIVMGYSALVYELLAPLLLLVRRLRVIGIAWGLLFLLMITLTMHDLIFFTLQLATFFIVFIDERLLISLRDRFVRRIREIRNRSTKPSPAGA